MHRNNVGLIETVPEAREDVSGAASGRQRAGLETGSASGSADQETQSTVPFSGRAQAVRMRERAAERVLPRCRWRAILHHGREQVQGTRTVKKKAGQLRCPASMPDAVSLARHGDDRPPLGGPV